MSLNNIFKHLYVSGEKKEKKQTDSQRETGRKRRERNSKRGGSEDVRLQ